MFFRNTLSKFSKNYVFILFKTLLYRQNNKNLEKKKNRNFNVSKPVYYEHIHVFTVIWQEN